MKNQLKKLAPFALVGILSGATTFGAINYFNEEQNNTDFSYFTTSGKNSIPAGLNGSSSDNFVKASKTTVPAVVTIRNYQNNTPSSGKTYLLGWVRELSFHLMDTSYPITMW